MLPEIHCQRYQDFQQILERLYRLISQPSWDAALLKAEIALAQQFFQDQLRSLDLDELDAVMEPRSRSLQVEINKQLRLLATDVMFLQAAKQAVTRQQRLEQVSDRVNTLIGYCDALLQKD